MKRDTIGDLGDSLADGLGLNSNGPMEDLDIDVSKIVTCYCYMPPVFQKSTVYKMKLACALSSGAIRKNM